MMIYVIKKINLLINLKKVKCKCPAAVPVEKV